VASATHCYFRGLPDILIHFVFKFSSFWSLCLHSADTVILFVYIFRCVCPIPVPFHLSLPQTSSVQPSVSVIFSFQTRYGLPPFRLPSGLHSNAWRNKHWCFVRLTCPHDINRFSVISYYWFLTAVNVIRIRPWRFMRSFSPNYMIFSYIFA
jgi:hypothetical protein